MAAGVRYFVGDSAAVVGAGRRRAIRHLFRMGWAKKPSLSLPNVD